jgi:hypothetical protein
MLILRLVLRLNLRLELRRHANSGYGLVFYWYLFRWKRWSIFQIEAVNFPNSMVLVRFVSLSPSGVRKAGVRIGPKHFVCKIILHLV